MAFFDTRIKRHHVHSCWKHFNLLFVTMKKTSSADKQNYPLKNTRSGKLTGAGTSNITIVRLYRFEKIL